MIDKGWLEAILLIVVIAIDIWYNYHLIEEKKEEPNHVLGFVFRIVIVGAIVAEASIAITLLRLVNAGMIYWFVFNAGLNKAREKPIDYIGTKRYNSLKEALAKYDGKYSIIDQAMLYSLPTIVWFALRGIVAIFCLFNMLYGYDPYGNFLN